MRAMRNQQLSSEDQRKVSAALAKCAAETKSIEDSDKLADAAYRIFKDELGDNPRLVKVACRVYNSCKSIHKLSAAGDDTRGDSFSLLDANGMAKRMEHDSAMQLQKSASAAFSFSAATPVPLEDLTMRKSASASSCEPAPGYFSVDRSELISQAPGYVRTVSAECEAALLKAASDANMAEQKLVDALELFAVSLSTLPADIRKEAAAQVCASGSELGRQVVACFNDVKPIQKVASGECFHRYKGSARITDPHVARAFEQVKKANSDLRDARAVQEVVTAQIADEVKGLFELVKEAAGIEGMVGAAAIAGATKDVPTFLGLTEEAPDKIRRSVYTNKVVNRQLQHSAERMFINLIMDKNIAKYPMPDVVRAYNLALAKLPVNMRLTPVTAHAALIKSDVISNLAEGGVPSKADTDKIVNILGAYNRLRSKDGLITENVAE